MIVPSESDWRLFRSGISEVTALSTDTAGMVSEFKSDLIQTGMPRLDDQLFLF